MTKDPKIERETKSAARGEEKAAGRGRDAKQGENTARAKWKRYASLAKQGDDYAAQRALVSFKNGIGIPHKVVVEGMKIRTHGVDTEGMKLHAMLAVVRDRHQRAKVGPLLKTLRTRLGDALKTAEALAEALAWPSSKRPKVHKPPSAAAGPPTSGEIVDFLGRAIASVDEARTKLSHSGPKPAVVGVLGARLAAAGVSDPAATDYLKATGIDKSDSPRSTRIQRQRDRKRGPQKHKR